MPKVFRANTDKYNIGGDMKRVEVQTEVNVIVEYHLNEQAATSRIVTLARLYPTAKISVSNVVKHVELKEEPVFTSHKYTEIK